MTIRVAVIGAGIMGADHARILARDVPGALVTKLVDLDSERASLVAEEIPGCVVADDALSVIASPDVDAVLIASSDATHAEYVHAALDARKPVLCEKPLAPTADECIDLRDHEKAVVSGGAPLVHVGFMRRFDPGYVAMRSSIHSGVMGIPLAVHSIGRGVSAPRGSDELTITGSVIHDLDIVPWLLGSPVAEVSWHGMKQSPEVDDRRDPQLILVRTADGVLSTVEVFLNARYGYDIRCEVVGSLGTECLVEPSRTIRDSGLVRGSQYAADWRPRFAEAYRLQGRAWIEFISRGVSSSLATIEDAVSAAHVCDAVIASMHSGGITTSVRIS